MENLFDEVLEKDEKIIKVIKPNKDRYIKEFWWLLIPICWPHLIILVVGSLFILPVMWLKNYNNTYYAYTNKRLIIRKGAFGNTYDSLEYKDITSTSIKVGFLDRKNKTGSLVFESPSSHHEHPMKFSYIQNPYQEMNEIKEQINLFNK